MKNRELDLANLLPKLAGFQSKGILPPSPFWPNVLSLPPELDQNLQKIFAWTSYDNIEYEISTFGVDNLLIHSPLIRGTQSSVKASHSISIKQSLISKTQVRREVLVDNQLTGNYNCDISDVKKKIQFLQLISFHSHPSFFVADRAKVYSFYSLTDMNSFLSGQMYCLGLITDRVWLACKTDRIIGKIGENGDNMLHRVSAAAFGGANEQQLHEVVAREMQRWGIVFYTGKIGGGLRRLN